MVTGAPESAERAGEGRFPFSSPERPRIRVPAVACLLAVGALLLAPVGSAHAPVVYTAPFKNTANQVSNSHDLAGCSRLTSSKIHWAALTGDGGWKAKASARSCANQVGSVGSTSYASAAGDLIVAVPIRAFTGTATPTSVAVAWTFTSNGSASSVQGGNCPAVVINPKTGYGSSLCFLEAVAELSASAQLVDLTNGSVFFSSNFFSGAEEFNYSYNDTTCYSFNCTNYNVSYSFGSAFSGPMAFTWFINGTLNHADQYYVICHVDAKVYTDVEGFPHSSAAAALNMATLGNGFSLASITVS